MTQQDVFDRMGVSHLFMSKCESGERVIDIAELWELSKIYENRSVISLQMIHLSRPSKSMLLMPQAVGLLHRSCALRGNSNLRNAAHESTRKPKGRGCKSRPRNRFQLAKSSA